MTSLQEVESLTVALSQALRKLREGRPFECHEQAVAYRFDTAIGVLDIMFNDALEMERQWKELDGDETGA